MKAELHSFVSFALSFSQVLLVTLKPHLKVMFTHPLKVDIKSMTEYYITEIYIIEIHITDAELPDDFVFPFLLGKLQVKQIGDI